MLMFVAFHSNNKSRQYTAISKEYESKQRECRNRTRITVSQSFISDPCSLRRSLRLIRCDEKTSKIKIQEILTINDCK